MKRPDLRRIGKALLPITIAFVISVILLAAVGVPPLEAFELIWNGAFGSSSKIGDTLMAWVPLTLAAAGLVVTFAAGLWNIGIDGQIIAGAIAASWVAREVSGPSFVIVTLAILAGIVGGVLWALLAGILKTVDAATTTGEQLGYLIGGKVDA